MTPRDRVMRKISFVDVYMEEKLAYMTQVSDVINFTSVYFRNKDIDPLKHFGSDLKISCINCT
jgi:hypothetical protein